MSAVAQIIIATLKYNYNSRLVRPFPTPLCMPLLATYINWPC